MNERWLFGDGSWPGIFTATAPSSGASSIVSHHVYSEIEWLCPYGCGKNEFSIQIKQEWISEHHLT